MPLGHILQCRQNSGDSNANAEVDDCIPSCPYDLVGSREVRKDFPEENNFAGAHPSPGKLKQRERDVAPFQGCHLPKSDGGEHGKVRILENIDRG